MADEQRTSQNAVPQPGAPAAGASAMPPELQAAAASKDDRTLAMIAHLLGLVGFLGPLILFLVKKEGASKFVLFHMKQSLWFQVGLAVAFIVLFVLALVVSVLTMGAGGCVCFPILGLVWLGGLIYCVIGAIQVNGGKDFEYMVVGPWVRKSL